MKLASSTLPALRRVNRAIATPGRRRLSQLANRLRLLAYRLRIYLAETLPRLFDINCAGSALLLLSPLLLVRALLARLDDCLTASDARGFLGLAETMMVLVQQHNMKEEQVLYPMADELLEDPQAVLAAMRARHQAE